MMMSGNVLKVCAFLLCIGVLWAYRPANKLWRALRNKVPIRLGGRGRGAGVPGPPADPHIVDGNVWVEREGIPSNIEDDETMRRSRVKYSLNKPNWMKQLENSGVSEPLHYLQVLFPWSYWSVIVDSTKSNWPRVGAGIAPSVAELIKFFGIMLVMALDPIRGSRKDYCTCKEEVLTERTLTHAIHAPPPPKCTALQATTPACIQPLHAFRGATPSTCTCEGPGAHRVLYGFLCIIALLRIDFLLQQSNNESQPHPLSITQITMDVLRTLLTRRMKRFGSGSVHMPTRQAVTGSKILGITYLIIPMLSTASSPEANAPWPQLHH